MNSEHVDELMRGVRSWNKWRRRNANLRPDLANAYFDGEYLSGANLTASS